MPISEQQAVERARQFVQTIRRELAYPVRDAPAGKSLSREAGHGAFAGREFWVIDFDYAPPPHLLVDPSGVRILVDSESGEAAIFTPR